MCFQFLHHEAQLLQLLHQSMGIAETIEEVLHFHKGELLLNPSPSSSPTFSIQLRLEHEFFCQLCCVGAQFGLGGLQQAPKLITVCAAELLVMTTPGI